MANTFHRLVVHVIFSTKHRQPLIDVQHAVDLHRYLVSTINRIGPKPLIVNGVADHVHLLFDLGTNAAVSDVVRGVKSNSSAWMRRDRNVPDFGWQDGYAAFGVSPQHVKRVVNYIRNQEEHHQQTTFEEEYVELLHSCGLEPDPKFIFDRDG